MGIGIMANTIFAGMGKFFFQFGILCFIVATFFSIIFIAYGIKIPGPISSMATLFPIVGISSVIMGIFGSVVSTGARMLFPNVGQLAGVATYLSMFLPAATGIASMVTMLINYLPLPSGIRVSMMGGITSLVVASIAYYLAVKVGYLPPE